METGRTTSKTVIAFGVKLIGKKSIGRPIAIKADDNSCHIGFNLVSLKRDTTQPKRGPNLAVPRYYLAVEMLMMEFLKTHVSLSFYIRSYFLSF